MTYIEGASRGHPKQSNPVSDDGMRELRIEAEM